MRGSTRLALVLLLACAPLVAASPAFPQSAFEQQLSQALHTARPYQTNNGQIPPKGEYPGPLFVLSHDWPTRPLPPLKNPPWRAAIHNGKITVKNAAAYAAALKKAVSKNARQLIMHYATWNAAKAGWYNEPWLGSVRESIHGTYAAGAFGPAVFPGTGLHAKFNTHVLTYYDKRAAYTLHKFWGKSSMKPNLATQYAQFPEGGIVVKAAVFASTDPAKPTNWWDALQGAQQWPLYINVGTSKKPQVWPGYVAQFDIIVKDTHSAPKTGWVFMTLVYDSSASGDIWDKMVPLGVQWGNDPQATKAGMPLVENWINPKAPKYSTQTLGWGGRLSGPNDGAVNNIVVGSTPQKMVPDSGCMSCHSTAQWNVQKHKMVSFLLPSTSNDPPSCDANGKKDPNGAYICSPAPGSPLWLKWFRNRLGTVPMDKGSFATDFDEVFSFKSLPLWWQAVGPANQPLPRLMRGPAGPQRFNLYTGAPLPD